MNTSASPINQTICQLCEIRYCLPVSPCDRCQLPAAHYTTAKRTAIDVHLDHPVLLDVTVSVHHCTLCDHYFRAQPPFLRPDAIYSAGVVRKAIHSVYEDGMAMRRVTARMARDFWVEPSEGIIRAWCRTYGAAIDFAEDYQRWVVSEFTGILCVDEVYQDRMALLLAVDPAAPDGDRLVGYQLVHGDVDTADMEAFLTSLKALSIEPDQVITDGSKLYPAVLSDVWPNAAHQLCLFHETRHVTRAVLKVISSVRKRLPHPPPATSAFGGGLLRSDPPSNDLGEPATQRWYWRQLRRHRQIARVHELAQQGLSQRAIFRQTGHHRRTIRRWLSQPVPALPPNMPVHISEDVKLSTSLQRQMKKQRLKVRVHELRQKGLSYSAIGRRVGIHRVTVKAWLQQELPSISTEEQPAQTEEQTSLPLEPWTSWDEVRQISESLRKHRFLLVHRPENLSAEEMQEVDALLASPIGAELRTAYSFLVQWYHLWTDENGQRRSLAEAKIRYENWRTDSSYQAVPHLRRVQKQMIASKFEQLSQFLRYPDWEATNNGVERTGRAFRHRQASHFNLRTETSIENSLKSTALLSKAKCGQPQQQPFHTCQRGRKSGVVLTQFPSDVLVDDKGTADAFVPAHR